MFQPQRSENRPGKQNRSLWNCNFRPPRWPAIWILFFHVFVLRCNQFFKSWLLSESKKVGIMRGTRGTYIRGGRGGSYRGSNPNYRGNSGGGHSSYNNNSNSGSSYGGHPNSGGGSGDRGGRYGGAPSGGGFRGGRGGYHGNESSFNDSSDASRYSKPPTRYQSNDRADSYNKRPHQVREFETERVNPI